METFTDWYKKTPKKFKDLVKLHITYNEKEFLQIMEHGDSEVRIEYSAQYNLLRDLYNNGVFGQPECEI